jgi:murein lipoprotein
MGVACAALLVAAWVNGGCATQASVRSLEERAEAHERRLSALEADVRRVDKTADDAVRRASAAEEAAQQAADRADAAARKADAIFTKSVRK